MQRSTRALSFGLALIALCVAVPSNAELTVSKLFGDGIVLQRDKPVNIWGWAKPGETVSLEFAGQRVNATANEAGKWLATLKPMEASFDSRDIVIAGNDEKLTIKDVLVGEVWLCGGQSNMAWSVGGSLNPDIEIASADTPAIRYLRLKLVASHEVQKDVPLEAGKGWRPCVPEYVRDCTAVGYHFARRLHRYLKVPIGIIDNSWGGTMAQYWCSNDTLKQIPEMKPYLDDFNASVRAWVDGGEQAGAEKRHQAALAKWEIDRMEALREASGITRKKYFQANPQVMD